MRLFRSVDDCFGFITAEHAAIIRRNSGLACHGESHKIRGRASARQRSCKTAAADCFGQPADHRSLDGHTRGRRTPRCHVLVQDGGDEIAQGGDRFGGTLHVTEEASVLSATVGNHAGQGGERGLA